MVSATTGFLDAGDRGQHLRRDLLVQLDVLVELGDHGAAHRLDFVIGSVVVAERRGRRRNMFSPATIASRGALRSFDQHLHGAVRQLQHLQDVGDAADAVEILFRGLILGRGFLGNQQDALTGLHCSLQRLDRLGTTDEERDDHMRERPTTSRSGNSGSSRGSEGSWGIRHQECLLVKVIDGDMKPKIKQSPPKGGAAPQFEPETLGWSA